MGRRALFLGYGFLALVLLGAGAGVFFARSAAHAASPCATAAADRDPMRAASTFVQTAVARQHVERSYRLVTAALREDLTCADWMTGSIPVQPYLNIVWSRTGIRIVQQNSHRVLLIVALRSSAADWPPSAFYLELLSREGRWLANGWSPAGGVAVPAATG